MFHHLTEDMKRYEKVVKRLLVFLKGNEKEKTLTTVSPTSISPFGDLYKTMEMEIKLLAKNTEKGAI